MSWASKSEDMICDGCTVKVVSSRRSRLATINEARRLSWTVVESETVGGGHMSVHLCPDCSHIKRERPPERLEGEIPLFE